MFARVRTFAIAAVAVAALALSLAAQGKPDPVEPEDEVQAADIAAFSAWLADYKVGAFRLVKGDQADDEALARIDELMQTVAKWNTLPAAKMLFEAASIEPKAPGQKSSTEVIDFYRELQPWK
ncbi:MAG: hypothetical protein KDC98_24860, partial [Planctomycetes bacterium]|nr:hypothetical protein [Planctomycetota bacterium]